MATLAVFALGWWATVEATRGKADHDPSEIVIDEVVGQWIALWPLSLGLGWMGVDPWVFPWPGWVVGIPAVPAVRHLETGAGRLGGSQAAMHSA